ncbi:MAG: peptidoglycan editing factor PgeF [Lachnospiraceae bacterium]|nr:peptidoglycan editing factor PgeF [Lachnospiraceae bacterium]
MEIIYSPYGETIDIITKNNVSFIQFPIFKDFPLVHGFSTRLGGVSKDHLSSMNFKRGEDESEENIQKNFELFAKALGISKHQLVLSQQTHTTNIRVVTKEDKGKGILLPQDYKDVDGLITKEEDIFLMIFGADCVPVFYYDPVKKVIGASHCGWKGTKGLFPKKMLERMKEEFGSNSADVITAIGPSICRDCYEVSKDVADEFLEVYSKEDYQKIVRDDKNGKYHIDLWEANRITLKNAGVKKENIFVGNLCTCCNPDFLFSHRASKGLRGVLGGGLMMKGHNKDGQ